MTLIFDSLFHPNAMIHANGGRAGHLPTVVRWHRPGDGYAPKRAVWYTDGWRPEERAADGIQRVGLLLEPREVHPENYEAARRWLDEGRYDYLFTHDPELLSHGDVRVYPYPLGGTRLAPADWRESKKFPDISIIASEKAGLPGHAVRHEIIRLQPGLHAYGPGYRPLPEKSKALRHHMFSVASECTLAPQRHFFSEHLLDCFLTMTIPIYVCHPDTIQVLYQWGFQVHGVIGTDSPQGVALALEYIQENPGDAYRVRREAALHNFLRAHDYVCTEDWLFRNHPSLFDEDSE